MLCARVNALAAVVGDAIVKGVHAELRRLLGVGRELPGPLSLEHIGNGRVHDAGARIGRDGP